MATTILSPTAAAGGFHLERLLVLLRLIRYLKIEAQLPTPPAASSAAALLASPTPSSPASFKSPTASSPSLHSAYASPTAASIPSSPLPPTTPSKKPAHSPAAPAPVGALRLSSPYDLSLLFPALHTLELIRVDTRQLRGLSVLRAAALQKLVLRHCVIGCDSASAYNSSRHSAAASPGASGSSGAGGSSSSNSNAGASGGGGGGAGGVVVVPVAASLEDLFSRCCMDDSGAHEWRALKLVSLQHNCIKVLDTSLSLLPKVG